MTNRYSVGLLSTIGMSTFAREDAGTMPTADRANAASQ
jgi:hypothetical protein